MAVSWATAAYTLNQLPLCFAVVAGDVAVSTSRYNTNISQEYSPKWRRFDFHLTEKHSSIRTLVAESNKVSSLQTHQGTWEDPDDGSGSEYDEDDEEVEENDLDFESDWEEEKDAPAAASVQKSQKDKYKEELVKEVEQLLGPEERAILQKSATPDLGKISTAKWNPLHALALSGQIPFMDKLLEQGIDINVIDQDGLTALHTAIIGRKDVVTSHLLRKGASPHVKDRDGATPLHYAIQVGAMHTVKLLLKYKVDLNVADNEGWTPLHVAVQSRNRDIVKVLLLNGADKNRRNKDGKTPLDLALCYGKDFNSYDLAVYLRLCQKIEIFDVRALAVSDKLHRTCSRIFKHSST